MADKKDPVTQVCWFGLFSPYLYLILISAALLEYSALLILPER